MKSTYIDIEILRKLFSGGESIRKLKDDCTIVPDVPGIYVVTKPLLQPASFLKTGTGGHFKGKDPNVEAHDESEAEAIGITMLENGALDCAGQICAAATAVFVQ